MASSWVAPGTITARDATYAAFSTVWRIMLARTKVIPAQIVNNKIGTTAANSTAVAPARLVMLRLAVGVVFMIFLFLSGDVTI